MGIIFDTCRNVVNLHANETEIMSIVIKDTHTCTSNQLLHVSKLQQQCAIELQVHVTMKMSTPLHTIAVVWTCKVIEWTVTL